MVQKLSSSSNSTWKCYKCQGYEHIASDCPNQRVVTIREDVIKEEEEVNQEDGELAEFIECRRRKIFGDSEEPQLNMIQKNEETWEETYFQTKCTSHGRLGEFAASQLLKMDPEFESNWVITGKIRGSMKDENVKKQPGAFQWLSLADHRRQYEGYEHIASDCPNQRVVTIREDVIKEEEEVNQEDGELAEFIECRRRKIFGDSEEPQLNMIQKNEETWEETYFQTKCTSHGRTTGCSPFEVVYGMNPFVPLALSPIHIADHLSGESDERAKFIKKIYGQVKDKILKQTEKYLG
ncbi:hypothetical protein ZIOFF_062668 [Zingiber officinale]|uniref:CCHC-type domain-containing protein n=1 Tax=Zingiber officinale TaxID=94328 RepID=A0A8J5F5P7_ZINOF|nr:hypothetical protein ZIOFF_062668 [Zingiber officinale]